MQDIALGNSCTVSKVGERARKRTVIEGKGEVAVKLHRGFFMAGIAAACAAAPSTVMSICTPKSETGFTFPSTSGLSFLDVTERKNCRFEVCYFLKEIWRFNK